MPPTDNGRPQTYPDAQQNRPASTANRWPPSLLDSAALAELPIPLQMMLVSALLPYEVAVTSVRIMKSTEALLGELVFHLNALRPAVFGVSQAYADGQFDQFFRTIDQIQQSTNAVALVWAPLTAVRDRLVPAPPAAPPAQAAQPAGRRVAPVPPRSAGYPPRPAPQPVTITAPPPSTIEYFGRLGGQIWDQAASLPGAGWLRRPVSPESETEPIPVTTPRSFEQHRLAALEAPEQPEPAPAGPSLLGMAAPLVPGPVRRLFGGH